MLEQNLTPHIIRLVGRIKGILIDFYGTISAGDREAVEGVCSRIVQHYDVPMRPADFAVKWGEQFFAMLEQCRQKTFHNLHECEVASLRATLGQRADRLDPEPLICDLEAYWANPPIHRDAREFLRSVSLPICCVSNADTQPLQQAISKHELRFDAVVTSEDARSYKPDRLIFEKALEALELPADAVVHIGDSLHSDVRGAAQLGITTVWVCRKDRIHDIGTCRADHTVSHLGEINGMLE